MQTYKLQVCQSDGDERLGCERRDVYVKKKKNNPKQNIFLAVSLRPRRKNCSASRFSKRSRSVAQKKPIQGKTDSNLIKFLELITLSGAENLLEHDAVYNLVGSHLCHIESIISISFILY